MRKWLILICVACINAINAYAFASISTIPEKAEDFYDVSALEINLFVQIFFVVYLLIAPFAPWLISKSYRKIMIITIGLMLAGAWVKLLSGDLFWGGLLGQGLIAVIPPVLLTSLPTMAELWFLPSQHLLVLTIGELSAFVGMATCFMVAPEISIPSNNLIQAVSITFFALFFLLIIKKDPVEQRHLGFYSLFLEVKAIFTPDCGHFLLILAAAGITGISYSFLGLIGEIFEDEDIDGQETSIIGFLLAIIGMLGGLSVNVLLAKGVSESLSVYIFSTGTIVSLLAWCIFVHYPVAAYTLGSAFGFFFFGLIPLGLKLTIEYNSTLRETVPSGVTLIIAQTCGLLFSYPIVYSKDMDFHSLWTIFLLQLIIGFALVAVVVKSSKRHNLVNSPQKSENN